MPVNGRRSPPRTTVPACPGGSASHGRQAGVEFTIESEAIGLDNGFDLPPPMSGEGSFQFRGRAPRLQMGHGG